MASEAAWEAYKSFSGWVVRRADGALAQFNQYASLDFVSIPGADSAGLRIISKRVHEAAKQVRSAGMPVSRFDKSHPAKAEFCRRVAALLNEPESSHE